MSEYSGDIIRLDRLIEFLPIEYWEWDSTGNICLDDISCAIHDEVDEVPEPYGDNWNYPVLEHKGRYWHIGRIIYFINHKTEIKDIEISNQCDGRMMLPEVDIIDGWHRYAAARWLYDQGKIDKIHCRYGGRMDILEFLKGETDTYLDEVI